MENQNHIHNFVDTVVPATCKEQGYTLHRCACGYEYKDQYIPTGMHPCKIAEQTEATCTEAGSQKLVCTVCGEVISRATPALGHDWSTWTLHTFPSCTENGSNIRCCSRCGATETQAIPATGHKLIKSEKSQTKKGVQEYFCQNCGQTVKTKTGFRKFKKLIIAVSLLLVLCILAAIFIPVLAPYYHYTMAKRMINKGKDEKAYSHLVDCKEYKDSEELLKHFLIIYGTQKYYIDGELDEKITFEYTPDTYTVNYTYYNKDGKVTSRGESKYSETGNYLGSISYNTNGKKTGKSEYTYDKNGNETSYSQYDSNGTMEYKYEYTYDKDGNKTSETRYESDRTIAWKYKYTYNKDGNLTDETHYNSNGAISWTYKYAYNKNGNVESVTTYYPSGAVSWKTEYTYDKNDNLISTIDCNADGEFVGKTKYTYDKDGNKTSETHYDSDETFVWKYEYTYNKDGICILYIYTYYPYGSDEATTHKYVYEDIETVYFG